MSDVSIPTSTLLCNNTSISSADAPCGRYPPRWTWSSQTPCAGQCSSSMPSSCACAATWMATLLVSLSLFLYIHFSISLFLCSHSCIIFFSPHPSLLSSPSSLSRLLSFSFLLHPSVLVRWCFITWRFSLSVIPRSMWRRSSHQPGQSRRKGY